MLKRIAAATLLFLLVTLCYLTGLLDNPDRFISDRVYTSYRTADPNIFVIGIDGDTLDRYGPWGSWSRMVTADLISYLNEDPAAKPAVIGVDILFSGTTTDREDGALADAVREGDNVVLTSQAIFSQSISGQMGNSGWDYLNIDKYEEPYDALRSGAECGLMNVFPDVDGIVRRSLYAFDYNGRRLHSFDDQVARAYRAHIGEPPPATPPLNRRGEWYIPFVAKPGEYFGTGAQGTSWVRVMDGEIPRELFADSIVLVGPYSLGMLDSYFTSADRRNQMFGVEIHANAIQSLLEGYHKQDLPGWIAVVITAGGCLLLYLVFGRRGVRMVTFCTGGLCLVYFTAAVGLFQLGLILPLFYPLLAFFLSYLALLISNYIILTTEKAHLYDQMQRLFVNSIRTIANAIDAKDPCTSGHCQRVSDYALMIGQGLGCSKNDLDDLEYSALLHDVGKIGISDSVLKKDGPLTDEEYAEMKTHPARGSAILGEIEEFHGRIADGARYHHERYDGRGYCEGLAGEQIPFFGRIIAIADAYDAMTQNRPYRRRLSKEVAISELEKGAGTQFDPELVRLFIQLVNDCPTPEESVPVAQEEIPANQ